MGIVAWWEAVCDVCGEDDPFGMLNKETLTSFTAALRKNGWSVNGYQCRCPNCKYKRQKED